jgi:hypothetical protein
MTKSALIDSASIGSASMDSSRQASRCIGLFQLAGGRALRLKATQAAQLKIVCGSAWVTLPSQTGDHFLEQGQSIDARAGDVVVIESLQRDADVKFDWQPAVSHRCAQVLTQVLVPAPSHLRENSTRSDVATDLSALNDLNAQALRDLRAAAGLTVLGVRGLAVATAALFLGAFSAVFMPTKRGFSSFFGKGWVRS